MTLQRNSGVHKESAGEQTVRETLGKLVLGIDHLALAVRHLDKALGWYVGVLGFELREQRVTRGERTGMKSAVLTCGNACIVLLEGVEPDSQVSRFIAECGEGVSHVALAVTDLDEALRRLEANAQTRPMEMVNGDGIRQVFLERDGHTGARIELIERRGGHFTDRSIRRLFRILEERNLY